MTTTEITKAHEYATQILEKIAIFESIIETHKENIKTYRKINSWHLVQEEEYMYDRRMRGIKKLWDLYYSKIHELKHAVTHHNH